MATKTFNQLLTEDVTGIFLNDDFSQDAIYRAGSNITTVVIQFFEEPLDKLGTQYYHAWCAFADMPHVSKNDTLEIKSVVYGIVDYSPDEFETGLNIFLQEV